MSLFCKSSLGKKGRLPSFFIIKDNKDMPAIPNSLVLWYNLKIRKTLRNMICSKVHNIDDGGGV